MVDTAKTIFLDRDGTINRDFEYVISPERVEIFPGTARALGDLVRAGFSLVVVSNQSAIGRGMCEESAVRETNAEVCRQLICQDADAKFSRILFCPHSPNDKCACRKPGIAMVTQAEPSYTFDPKRSWMVGDKGIDMSFGLNLGLPPEHCLLLSCGSKLGAEESGYPYLFRDLPQAARHILVAISQI